MPGPRTPARPLLWGRCLVPFCSRPGAASGQVSAARGQSPRPEHFTFPVVCVEAGEAKATVHLHGASVGLGKVFLFARTAGRGQQRLGLRLSRRQWCGWGRRRGSPPAPRQPPRPGSHPPHPHPPSPPATAGSCPGRQCSPSPPCSARLGVRDSENFLPSLRRPSKAESLDGCPPD